MKTYDLNLDEISRYEVLEVFLNIIEGKEITTEMLKTIMERINEEDESFDMENKEEGDCDKIIFKMIVIGQYCEVTVTYMNIDNKPFDKKTITVQSTDYSFYLPF